MQRQAPGAGTFPCGPGASHLLRGSPLAARTAFRSGTSRAATLRLRAQAADGRASPVGGARTAALRRLLAGPHILKGPCCHDALSARLIEQAGFDYAFMSGFCTAGARLGAPDTGLISYYEMVDQGRHADNLLITRLIQC